MRLLPRCGKRNFSRRVQRPRVERDIDKGSRGPDIHGVRFYSHNVSPRCVSRSETVICLHGETREHKCPRKGAQDKQQDLQRAKPAVMSQTAENSLEDNEPTFESAPRLIPMRSDLRGGFRFEFFPHHHAGFNTSQNVVRNIDANSANDKPRPPDICSIGDGAVNIRSRIAGWPKPDNIRPYVIRSEGEREKNAPQCVEVEVALGPRCDLRGRHSCLLQGVDIAWNCAIPVLRCQPRGLC